VPLPSKCSANLHHMITAAAQLRSMQTLCTVGLLLVSATTHTSVFWVGYARLHHTQEAVSVSTQQSASVQSAPMQAVPLQAPQRQHH
jgi:hypothetical protein